MPRGKTKLPPGRAQRRRVNAAMLPPPCLSPPRLPPPRLPPPWQACGPFDKKPGAFAQFGREGGDDAVFKGAPFKVGAVDRFLRRGKRLHAERIADHERQRGDRHFRQFFGGSALAEEIDAATVKLDQRPAALGGSRRPAGE